MSKTNKVTFSIVDGMMIVPAFESSIHREKWVAVIIGEKASDFQRAYLNRDADRVELLDVGANTLLEVATGYKTKRGTVASKSQFYRVVAVADNQLCADAPYSTLIEAMDAVKAASFIPHVKYERVHQIVSLSFVGDMLDVTPVSDERTGPTTAALCVGSSSGSMKRYPLLSNGTLVATGTIEPNTIIELAAIYRTVTTGRDVTRVRYLHVLEASTIDVVVQLYDRQSDAVAAARKATAAKGDDDHDQNFDPMVFDWDFETVPLWAELRTEGLIDGWYGAGADR